MKPFMQKLGMLAAMLCIFLSASAYVYDFEVDGIYYNITDPAAKEVEVTSGSFGGYSGDIIVPSSVTYNGADYNVTAIWEDAFNCCSNMTSIVIPKSVTTLGRGTFNGCEGLTTITLPNTMTTIGVYAFNGCSSLPSITIPGSVTTIGDNAFYRCSSLTKIEVADDNQAYSSKDGILYDKLQETLICCPRGKVGDVIIPNTVTTIGNNAITECGGLTTITLPGSVTTIGDNAFYMCDSMTKIEVADDNQAYSSKDGILYDKLQETLICCPGGKAGEIIIPGTVTTIRENAFAMCSSLTSIEIPNSVTTIGKSTFTGCDGLTTINIPNSVTAIEDNTFGGCGGLTTITIPNSVTAIGKEAFSECDGLTTITLPNSVTTIEDYTFTGCSDLTTITLPNAVTTIGVDAFAGCSSLTTITIPKTVTTIGEGTFYDCNGLRSIISLAVTPPECGSDVFEEIDKQKCKLYVPTGSVEAYRQAPGWKDFDIVEETETGIDSIEAGDAASATEVFNLAGLKVADTPESLPAGIYIVREGLTARKIVVR